MPCSKITNNSNFEVDKHQPMFDSFFPYSQKVLGFDKPFSLNFASDQENSANPLGRTAHYDPSSSEITIYVDGRHIKDIMRSISHELVHHAQNCRGEFDKGISTDAGYAQEDGHLRGMEREAYEKGNLCFRDWEDQYKQLRENKMTKLVKKEIKKLLKEAYNPLDPQSRPAAVPSMVDSREQKMLYVIRKTSWGKNYTDDFWNDFSDKEKLMVFKKAKKDLADPQPSPAPRKKKRRFPTIRAPIVKGIQRELLKFFGGVTVGESKELNERDISAAEILGGRGKIDGALGPTTFKSIKKTPCGKGLFLGNLKDVLPNILKCLQKQNGTKVKKPVASKAPVDYGQSTPTITSLEESKVDFTNKHLEPVRKRFSKLFEALVKKGNKK